MTITGVDGALFAHNYGFSRVVPARELSLLEIRTIKEQVPVEIECFIHGAMCYGYSGQCLFSSILGGRSGNRRCEKRQDRSDAHLLRYRGTCFGTYRRGGSAQYARGTAKMVRHQDL